MRRGPRCCDRGLALCRKVMFGGGGEEGLARGFVFFSLHTMNGNFSSFLLSFSRHFCSLFLSISALFFSPFLLSFSLHFCSLFLFISALFFSSFLLSFSLHFCSLFLSISALFFSSFLLSFSLHFCSLFLFISALFFSSFSALFPAVATPSPIVSLPLAASLFASLAAALAQR
jgi:hypothetical protein